MWKILMLCVVLLFFTGCTESFLVGAGAGALGTETLNGADSDLATLELSLQEQLAVAVADGDQEKIERLERAIFKTQSARRGVAVGKEFIGVDWSDPEAVGVAGGGLVSLALSVLYGLKQQKKYKAHKRGAETFMRESETGIAEKLYANIGDERKKL
jgi:hypothetical protein